ncbi:MAG: tripartite tricarboxylate transporter substrate binding protein [Burkholderiales bacterium]
MKLHHLFVLLALGAAPAAAIAAESPYPTKPIRIIVGFPPAGAADIFARLVGQKLTEVWGQAVIVDNRPGAGSTIGSEIVAGATPDGYTLMVVSASYATSAGLYQKLKYDPIKSFAPIILITSAPNVAMVHPSVAAKSTRELIAAAKASPGKLNVGSAGTGSITHLAGELFQEMAGIDLTHVPYKGGGPALNALIAGQIHMAIQSITASLGHIQPNRVRALGVTSSKRSPLLPDLPTIAEAVPGYEAANWYGMLAPAGTPRAIVAKLNSQVAATLTTPEMADAIRKQGAQPEGGTPEAFGKYLQNEITKWTKVIRKAGVKAD